MYHKKLIEHKKFTEKNSQYCYQYRHLDPKQQWINCGITGHWTDSNWKLTSVALGCLLVGKRHTDENIAYFYEEFVAKWGNTDKICFIVTFSPWTMVAIRQTAYSHIPSFTPCLQRSIYLSLKVVDSSPLVAICRHLVWPTNLNWREAIQWFVAEIWRHFPQISAGCGDSMEQYLHDVSLARMLEVITAIIQKTKEDLNWLTQFGTKFLSYISVLGSLADATEYVGSEQYVLPFFCYG